MCTYALVGAEQVLQDLDLGADEVADGELEAVAAGEAWRQQATLFLKGEHKASADIAKRRPRFRLKAFKWLLALDRMLSVSLGVGLRRFLAWEEHSRPHPRQWQILTVSLDQGSDGWSAVQFLANGLPFGVMALADPSHRCWNDCQLSLKDSQTWGAVQLMTIVLNLDSGPWRDARWYQQAREAVEAYLKTATPETCPIWQMMFSRVVADRGEQVLMGAADYERDLFANLGEAWSLMSQKVGMARWFGWTDAMESYLPRWHMRLLVLLFMCISLGVLGEGHHKMLVKGADMQPQALQDEQKAGSSLVGGGQGRKVGGD